MTCLNVLFRCKEDLKLLGLSSANALISMKVRCIDLFYCESDLRHRIDEVTIVI